MKTWKAGVAMLLNVLLAKLYLQMPWKPMARPSKVAYGGFIPTLQLASTVENSKRKRAFMNVQVHIGIS